MARRPRRVLSPTSKRILLESSFSASNVSELNKSLMSTQQNKQALLFKHSIPAPQSPEKSIFLSTFESLSILLYAFASEFLVREHVGEQKLSLGRDQSEA